MSDPIIRLNAALEGRYRIERGIGEGGMATVYLAEDLRHERRVALKVLKPDLAAVIGADRFLAEIKTTANLHHPHILPLFDSGEADSFLFYVMPYVEGESLQEKLRREHELPLDEAVRIATSVAEALDYAHRQGVVHRDIKPGNVLLHDGKPVVSDFGIALAAENTEGRMTETGRSLGTPNYMSPEQATGDHNVGPPTDIYALGCVLYEMLVGEAPHTAGSPQAVLAKVLTVEAPSARGARASIPQNVDAAIDKALSRLPADRFQRASSFRDALLDPHFRHGGRGPGDTSGEVGRWRLLAFGSVAVAGISLLAAAWFGLTQDSPNPPVLKVSMALSGEELVIPPNGSAVTLSPDGSTFLYGGFAGSGRSERWQLWARRLDQFEATPLPGTEEGVTPAFSPDGSEVAFTQGGVRTPILIVPLSGGPQREVGEDVLRAGLDWASDGMLYYVRVGHGISRVPGGGGDVEVVTTLDTDSDETGHRWLDVLPDGRSAVFSIGRSGPQETWDIGVVRFGESEHRVLTTGLYPRYVASGHLLWVLADGTLMAAPFNTESLELEGQAVSVMENVNIGNFSAADYAVGEDGTLVFLQTRRLEDVPVWVARDGTEAEIPGDWVGALSHPRLSPDGSRVLLGIAQESGSDVWIKELEAGPLSRLTFGASNYRGEWAEGGRSVTFLSDREGQGAWQISADGSGSAVPLLDEPRFINEALVTPGGEWLMYRLGSGGERDLMARRLDGEENPVALATTPFEESAARVSPDGRWLAHVSNESGQNEIYVRPFPSASGSKQQISTAGGREPMWSRDGTELFYRDASNQLIAMRVGLAPTFELGQRTELFSTVPYKETVTYSSYDVAPDGERFLMIRSLAAPGEMKLVQNFFQELRRLAPN